MQRSEQTTSRLLLLVVLLLWLAFSLPLVLGLETLFLRDVFSIHLHFKAFGAQELAEGRIPAINPTRGLGQPFRGNPNTLAFYPGNLLYLILPFWSAFNSHYVLHWLLSFFTMRALARELRQSPIASLTSALTYAGCGWMMSNLSFYNLLTVAAWWPLAILGAARGGRRGIALGALGCGMALLGGEPVTAALAMLPLIWVAVARQGLWPGCRNALMVGALGLLLALPQLVAALQVLAFTYRGAHGYTAVTSGYALHPMRLWELLIPLPFGQPDQMGTAGFWASRIGDLSPFFLSLHFGIVGLALAAVGMRRHRTWSIPVVLGLLIAWLGGQFPEMLAQGSGGLFRYPEKFVTWSALIVPLLVGWGVDATRSASDVRARGTLLASGASLVLAGLVLLWGTRLVAWLGAGRSAIELSQIARHQIPRWCLWLLLAALLLALTARLQKRRNAAGLAFLQLIALTPLAVLAPTDSIRFYREPAPWRHSLESGSGVVMSSMDSPFGLEKPVYLLPDRSRAHMTRIGHLDLDYPTGVIDQLTYPLAPDIEGMQSPLARLLQQSLPGFDWQQRLVWMRLLGVEALSVAQDLDLAGLALEDRVDRFGVATSLYRIEEPAPRVWWPRSVQVAGNPRQVLEAVTDSPDPMASPAVAVEVLHSPGAAVDLVLDEPDKLEIEVRGPGGLLVVQRAFQPILKARSGSQPLDILPVNLVQLGVVVPPGSHRVEIVAPAAPEIVAASVALVTLILLLLAILRTPSPVAPGTAPLAHPDG